MLEGRGITFAYNKKGKKLFKNINLQIHPGEIVGMPGPSGQGKSTLAKVLSGYLPHRLEQCGLMDQLCPRQEPLSN